MADKYFFQTFGSWLEAMESLEKYSFPLNTALYYSGEPQFKRDPEAAILRSLDLSERILLRQSDEEHGVFEANDGHCRFGGGSLTWHKHDGQLDLRIYPQDNIGAHMTWFTRYGWGMYNEQDQPATTNTIE